jgi:hypothetical protein
MTGLRKIAWLETLIKLLRQSNPDIGVEVNTGCTQPDSGLSTADLVTREITDLQLRGQAPQLRPLE